MLDQLGIVDELSFGSSMGDIESIALLTEASLSTTRIYGERIRERMKQGDSYPAAVWEIIRQRYGSQVADKMQDPNNLLAIEYMKAMQKQKVTFSAYTIPRRIVLHDSEKPSGHYASASFIRKSVMEGENYADFMPPFAAKRLADCIREGSVASFRQLERVSLYRMRTASPEYLLALPDANEALVSRFIAARSANSLEEMLMQVKTRCYTMARIRRIVISALLGIRSDSAKTPVPYARVLAFSDRGRELMGIAKGKSRIPISTSLARLRQEGGAAEAFVKMEERASHVYGLAQRRISSAEEDFRARIVMEDRA